jgi:hypothetical protein
MRFAVDIGFVDPAFFRLFHLLLLLLDGCGWRQKSAMRSLLIYYGPVSSPSLEE